MAKKIKLYYQDKNGKVIMSEEAVPTKKDKTAAAVISEEQAEEELLKIKTVNGQSLIGEGNVEIGGGSGNVDDVKVNGTSVLNNKVADIKLKTINGQALEGSGNVVVNEGTTVIANPEITGEEDDLETIQIGSTKFIIPGSDDENVKLYDTWRAGINGYQPYFELYKIDGEWTLDCFDFQQLLNYLDDYDLEGSAVPGTIDIYPKENSEELVACQCYVTVHSNSEDSKQVNIDCFGSNTHICCDYNKDLETGEWNFTSFMFVVVDTVPDKNTYWHHNSNTFELYKEKDSWYLELLNIELPIPDNPGEIEFNCYVNFYDEKADDYVVYLAIFKITSEKKEITFRLKGIGTNLFVEGEAINDHGLWTLSINDITVPSSEGTPAADTEVDAIFTLKTGDLLGTDVFPIKKIILDNVLPGQTERMEVTVEEFMYNSRAEAMDTYFVLNKPSFFPVNIEGISRYWIEVLDDQNNAINRNRSGCWGYNNGVAGYWVTIENAVPQPVTVVVYPEPQE